ncbi:MAG: 1-(5-phosphoribosyl)-5-[(5-phosphoribosylamino)methylideneamino]imidazole-4-carboxamide isomerase [Algisphaera sp.]
MHLFPAIDLREGRVVRLMQGDYDRQTTYGDDPVAQAQVFADAGATWLHLVDLDGARSGDANHRAVIADICKQTSLKLEVGGGVRDEESIDALLGVGVERVVVGTAAFKRWDWFSKMIQRDAYRNRVVLGLDAKGGMAATDGWEETTSDSAVDVAAKTRGWPLAAIVYTDIATDGTLKGPNVPATAEICAATDVPVVASGGVGTLDHLVALRALPVQGAIVGRAIYENTLTIDDALAVFEKGKAL